MAEDQHRHQLFRNDLAAAVADALFLFSGDNGATFIENYIKGQTNFWKRIFFCDNSKEKSVVNSSTKITGNFVDTYKQFDRKDENKADFFDRLERKIESTSFENVITILDILLPTHLYLSCEKEKN